MRLFDQQKTLAIGLSAFLAVTGSAAASETSYYSGKPWSVVLHVPETQDERPYCAFRTTLWETRTISIETMIGAGDAMAIALRVRKESWQLPRNQTTTIGAESVVGTGAEVPMKAISEHELYSDVPAASVPQYNFVFATMLQLMLAPRQPQPLTIKRKASGCDGGARTGRRPRPKVPVGKIKFTFTESRKKSHGF